MAIDLSVVIPTYNEKSNIQPLLNLIIPTLQGINWEVIFVDDDSPDGTADFIRGISKTNSRIRCIQRINRRGLSSACIEGMLSSSATYFAVMDADLQHDVSLLKNMFETINNESLDLVVGSRYVEGGNLGQFSLKRKRMSRFATQLSRLIIKIDLKDPMSGYFMIKNTFFHNVVRRLSGKGFKILLDICASCNQDFRFKELPFHFGQRLSGESKLNEKVLFEYFLLIFDKLLRRMFSVKVF